MFTGIIECLGKVQSILDDGSVGKDLYLTDVGFGHELKSGASVAINGVCLTLVEQNQGVCKFQVGPETLERTNLGQLAVGDRVNLEAGLKLGDRLDGHMVQGHVDAVGTIECREPSGPWETVWFRCPASLTSMMVEKGSIAVDGISLTLVDVKKRRFSVALIPHTLANSTLGFKQPGDTVNLETDIIGKYAIKFERQNPRRKRKK
jgi:riboflavin synthase